MGKDVKSVQKKEATHLNYGIRLRQGGVLEKYGR